MLVRAAAIRAILDSGHLKDTWATGMRAGRHARSHCEQCLLTIRCFMFTLPRSYTNHYAVTIQV